jgi:hypothetical protein
MMVHLRNQKQKLRVGEVLAKLTIAESLVLPNHGRDCSFERLRSPTALSVV